MVTEILNNIVYLGHLAQKKGSQCLYGGIPYHVTSKKEWIVVKNTHEPLISQELFDQVQQINIAAREAQKANLGKYNHLPKEKNLYGKKFTCADCGGIMKLQRSFNAKKDKAYFTFKCPTFAEHGALGCSDIKMRKADLDEAVLSIIKSQMDVFIHMETTLQNLLKRKKAASTQSDTQQQIKSLSQKLAHKQALLRDIYIDLKGGLLSQQDYNHHREIILEDISSLEDKLQRLDPIKNRLDEQLTGEMKWKFMVQRFYDAEEISAEMVEAFIETMQLHRDGSLEIKFSYMDEFTVLNTTCEKLRKEVA